MCDIEHIEVFNNLITYNLFVNELGGFMKMIFTVLSFVLVSTLNAQVINEIHADPASGLSGDANNDGVRSSDDDEFVEIVNNTGALIDIGGWTLSDGVGIRHTFPSPTNVPSGGSVVVFGGGSPVGIPGIVQTTTSLSLNNTGDDVILKDGANNIIDSYTYGSEGNNDQSIAREPDISGNFVKHNDITTNPVNFSPGESNTDSTPLPVELTTFLASVVDNNVELNWATATEVNNYGFNLERKPETGDWNMVVFVEGAGNSNSPKNYSYMDNSVVKAGTYLYRLKQVDIDGSFEYSEVVEVSMLTSVEFNLSQNFPNPFNPTTTISFSIPSVESGNIHSIRLTVFNVIGEQVAELVNQNMEAGSHSVQFDASELNSGIYIYKIEADGFSQIRKMILVK